MAHALPLVSLVACTLVITAPLQASRAVPHGCHGRAAAESPAADPDGLHAPERQPTPQHHSAHSPEPQPAPSHSHGHASVQSEAAAEASGWSASGRYLDACRCNAPCPCHFGVGKDYETCDPALIYHVTEGRFEDVRLDGLTVVVVATPRFARIYLDDRADDVQGRGLETLARRLTATLLRKGFPLAADQALIRRPIHVALSDERAEVTIPGVLEITADRLIGGDGVSRIVLQNMNLGPSWMEEAWAGRAGTYRYQDAAAWEYSGRNAYFGRFSVAASPAPANSDAPGRR